MLIDPNDEIGWQILMQHAYEPALTNLVKRELEPCGTFVDIGANHGWFSLLAAAILDGSRGKVVAFEPQHCLAERLKQSCHVNGFRNVGVLEAAAGDLNGYGTLQPGPVNFSGYARMAPACASKGLVKIIRLDSLLQEFSPTLVKIDVEGFELKVLQGMGELLCHPSLKALIVEMHPELIAQEDGTPEQLVKILKECGYTVSVVDMVTTQNAGQSLKPLKECDLSCQHYHLFASR